MTRPQRVTVLGASGGIGNAVVRELTTRGHAVTAVNRSGDADVPPGVERRAGDVENLGSAVTSTTGTEVIVMAAQPPYGDWHGRFERMIDNVLAAAEIHGARLVMVDNLYMYGAPAGPITEASPEQAATRSNVLRRELGETLLAAHREGRARVTIGRLSDYYGPGGHNTAVTAMAILPGVAGRTMRGVLDLDAPHTFHYLPDAARGLATLVEDERADGRAWILPAAPPITQRELLALVNRHLPTPVKVRRMSRTMLRIGALFVPEAREMLQVAHQFAAPWVVDASRFEATFGPIETTSHDEAVAATMAWFRDQASAASRKPMTRVSQSAG